MFIHITSLKAGDYGGRPPHTEDSESMGAAFGYKSRKPLSEKRPAPGIALGYGAFTILCRRGADCAQQKKGTHSEFRMRTLAEAVCRGAFSCQRRPRISRRLSIAAFMSFSPMTFLGWMGAGLLLFPQRFQLERKRFVIFQKMMVYVLESGQAPDHFSRESIVLVLGRSSGL